jgi:hypothetical protein
MLFEACIQPLFLRINKAGELRRITADDPAHDVIHLSVVPELVLLQPPDPAAPLFHRTGMKRQSDKRFRRNLAPEFSCHLLPDGLPENQEDTYISRKIVQVKEKDNAR